MILLLQDSIVIGTVIDEEIMDPSLPTQSRQTVQYQGIVRTPTENTR